MKVKDVMTSEVRTCTRETNLAKVAEIMWINDIGILPVVDESRRLVGLITDRDVCVAAGTRPLLAAQITAGSVMSGRSFVCKPDDDLKSALRTMRTQRVRRVPVVDSSGVIQGLLSIDDIAIAAQKGGDRSAVTFEDVVLTLKALSQHDLPARIESGQAIAVAAR
ncbi:MAG TPA: CBS domain-containing protein [Blastocatellia bacterium]|nr:CBS domain-containing protein [Blastocatellia bacterium]